jgi:hypothetical protein
MVQSFKYKIGQIPIKKITKGTRTFPESNELRKGFPEKMENMPVRMNHRKRSEQFQRFPAGHADPDAAPECRPVNFPDNPRQDVVGVHYGRPERGPYFCCRVAERIKGCDIEHTAPHKADIGPDRDKVYRAERDHNPVGFLFWQSDFNEFHSAPAESVGVKE